MLRLTFLLNPLYVVSLLRRADGQFIEFIDRHGEREVQPVSPENPASISLRHFELPPSWVRPFMKVRLRLQTEELPSEPWKGHKSGFELRVRTSSKRLYCSLLRPIASFICQDCSTDRCGIKADKVFGSHDVAATLPPGGLGIYVYKLPDGVDRARCSWEMFVDPVVIMQIIAGCTLVWGWKVLRSNVTLHAGIGGVASIVFIAMMVFIWLSRSIRGTVHGTVPFSRTVTSFGALILAFVPAAREVALGWATQLMGPVGDLQAWFGLMQFRDPIYNLPIGMIATVVIAFACCCLVILGATLSVKYFAAEPDPEGDVPFTIASDGSRVDLLPPAPGSQRLLGWTFWLVGIMLLLTSTDSDMISLSITFLAVFKENILHIVNFQLLVFCSVERPENLRKLVTSKEMAEQSRIKTQAALSELQRYIRANPHAVRSVREDSELRLRRFSDGGAHFQAPLETVDVSTSSWCTIL